MTPPVLYELLENLHEWMFENIRLIESDPDEFYTKLEHFITYVVSRAHREGVRVTLQRLEPKEN